MKKFILSTDHKDFAIKLLLFYILNLTDLIFTQFLLFKAPNCFVECNKFLQPIITDFQGVVIKIVIPLILTAYWFFRMRKADSKDYKISNVAILAVILFFIIINIMHIFNLIIYCKFL